MAGWRARRSRSPRARTGRGARCRRRRASAAAPVPRGTASSRRTPYDMAEAELTAGRPGNQSGRQIGIPDQKRRATRSLSSSSSGSAGQARRRGRARAGTARQGRVGWWGRRFEVATELERRRGRRSEMETAGLVRVWGWVGRLVLAGRVAFVPWRARGGVACGVPPSPPVCPSRLISLSMVVVAVGNL